MLDNTTLKRTWAAAACIALLLIGSSNALAHDKASNKQCASWERQLIKVNQRLRDGYTAKQGNKLRKKRRRLEDNIRRRCK